MNMLTGAEGTSRPRLDQQYPTNCWWVVARTDEVTNTPTSKQILLRRVVLVRMHDGTIMALDDRCAHRRAPLSLGRLAHDEIECRYHGLRFNRNGSCTRVPSESYVPGVLKVRTYPVLERGPFVWIWTGETQAGDPSLVPQLPPTFATGNLRVGGYMQINCSYMILMENNMDPAHFQFLHASDRAAGVPEHEWIPELFRITTKVTSSTVSLTINTCRPPNELETLSMDLRADENLQKSAKSTYYLPSCWIQKIDILRIAASGEILGRHCCDGVMCVTPISPSRCHFWWLTMQDYGENLADEWQTRYNRILTEDKEMLEAVQITIDEDQRENARDILIKADRAVSDIRLALSKIVEAEAHARYASPT